MATIDTKTSVYEITRSTIPSIININQYIDNRIDNSVENAPGIDGKPGVDGEATSMTWEELTEWLDDWIVGFNFIYQDNSSDTSSWYQLQIGLKSEWTEDIYSAAGLTMETIANKYYSKAEIDLFSYSTFDQTSAYVDSKMLTYADGVQAIASNQTLLEATYGDITASIVDGQLVYAGESNIVLFTGDPCANGVPNNSNDTLHIGTIAKYVDRLDVFQNPIYTYKQYIGDSILNGGCSWVVTSTADAVTTMGTAKSLYTDPVTGYVTGWQYVGNSSGTSDFVVSAGNFYIQDGTNGNAVPFKVENGVTTIGINTIAQHLGSKTSAPSLANDGDSFKYIGPTNDTYTYSTVYIWADGGWSTTKGEDGSRGAASTSYSSTTPPTISLVNTAFVSSTGFTDYVKGDTVTYTDTTSGTGGTTTWRRLNDGASWTEYALLVNGNAIVEGTLNAGHINLGGNIGGDEYPLVIHGIVTNHGGVYRKNGIWTDGNSVFNSSVLVDSLWVTSGDLVVNNPSASVTLGGPGSTGSIYANMPLHIDNVITLRDQDSNRWKLVVSTSGVLSTVPY